MSVICPRVNTSEWKALESKYGYDYAWKLYMYNNSNIPSLEEAKLLKIKHEKVLSKFIFEGVELSSLEKTDLLNSLKYFFIKNLINNFDTIEDIENLLEDTLDSKSFINVYDKALENIIDAYSEKANPRLVNILVAVVKDHPTDFLRKEYGIEEEDSYKAGLIYNQFKKELSNIVKFVKSNDEDPDTNKKEEVSETTKDSYGKESIEQNRKDTFSRGIKLLLSGVPELTKNDELVLNSLGMAQPINANKVNNELLNLFANTPATTQDFLEKVYSEADTNPTVNWIYEKVFSNVSTDPKTGELQMTNSNISELPRFNMLVKFIQSFANHKYQLDAAIVSNAKEGTSIKVQDADTNKLTNRILKEWQANILKALDTGVVLGKRKIIFKNVNDFVSFLNAQDESLEDKVAVLGLPQVNEKLLDASNQTNTLNILNNNIDFIQTFFDLAGLIKDSVKETPNNKGLLDMFEPKTKNTKLHAYTVGLLEFTLPYRKDYDNQQFNTDGNLMSTINLNSFQTLLLNRLNNAVAKARVKFPKDSVYNNFENIYEELNKEVPEALNQWSSDSKFMQRILSGEKLNIKLLDGMVATGGEGKSTSALVETDLWGMFINSTLNNVFPAIKHADRSMFYGYEFGFGGSDVLSTAGYMPDSNWKNRFTDILFDYLDTEIQRARIFRKKTSETVNIQNINKLGKEFILFSEILDTFNSNKLHRNKIDSLITDYTNIQDLKEDRFVASLINRWMDKYFAETISQAKEVGIGEAGKGIDVNVSTKLFNALEYSQRGLKKDQAFYDEVISLAAAKFFIGAVEQTKLFTGDPALYQIKGFEKNLEALEGKSKENILIYDFIKRINMQSSTKMVSVVDDVTNNFLNNLAAEDDFKFSINGKPKQSYNKNFDGTIRELVINDPKTVSSLKAELALIFKDNPEALEAYTEKGFEETDGFSIGNIFFALEGIFRTEGIHSARLETVKRELKFLSGSKEDIDKLYTVPEGEDPEKYFSQTVRPFTQQKFQYVGPNYMKDRNSFIEEGEGGNWRNRIGVTAGRKTSYGYLMPSVVKGTILEQLNNFMLANAIDVIHFASAAKFGSGKTREFYKVKEENGVKITDGFNDSPILNGELGFLDFRYLGKQQEIAYETKGKVTDSTQGRKINLSGIMEDGVPIDYVGTKEEWNNLSDEDKLANSELFRYITRYDEIYNELIQEFISELQAGYELSNTFSITNPLKFVNLIRKQAEDRVSPDNIIDAIIDWAKDDSNLKYIESLANYQKIQYVLTSIVTNNLLLLKRPGTMFPQSPSTGYESIDSNRTFEGRNLQSNDELKFYTFDKDKDGNIIKVNPAEIMIPLPLDKVEGLFNYYDGSNGRPNAKRNINKLLDIINNQIAQGDLRHQYLVKGVRIPNQQLSSNDVFKVKKFLNPIYNQTIVVPNEILVKNGSDFDIDKESLYFPILDDEMKPKDSDKMTIVEKLHSELLDLEIKLLLHPKRISRLLMPVTEGYLKTIAKKAQRRNIKTVNKQPTHLFALGSLVEGTLDYVGGKQGVGVVATWITFQKLAERYNLVLKPAYADDKGDYISTALNGNYLDGKDIFNQKGDIVFSKTVNTNTIDEEQDNGEVKARILKEQIEDVLSNLITSQVDIVKDKWASEVNIKLNTLNLVCYLVMRGASTKSIVDFINTPAIRQYNKIQEVNRAMSIKSPFPNKKKKIVEFIAGKGNNYISQILYEYIKVSDEARQVKDLKDFLSADTKYLKSPEEVWEVDNTLWRKLNSPQSMFDRQQLLDLRDNTLLSGFIQSRSLINTIFDPLYLTRNSLNRDLIEKQSILTNRGFSHIFKDTTKKAAIKIYNEHFINFLIQNQLKSVIESKYENLMRGKNSMAKRILAAKDNPKFENNYLIQQLVSIIDNKLGNSTEQVMDNVKLFLTKTTTTETNNLSNNFEEIESIDKELYEDLVYFNLFQAGISNSPYQLGKILSYKGQKLVLDALNDSNIQNLITDNNLAIFYEKFFKNNGRFNELDKDLGSFKSDDPYNYTEDMFASFEGLDMGYNFDISDIFDNDKDSKEDRYKHRLFTKGYNNEGLLQLKDKEGNIISPTGGVNGINYIVTKYDTPNKDILELLQSYETINLEVTKPSISKEATEVEQDNLKPAFTGYITQSMFGENDVMVFGANKAGFHGQGVAALAYANTIENYKKWNPNLAKDVAESKVGDFAIAGKTGLMEGNKGTGYGLVTVERPGVPLNYVELGNNIEELYNVARQNPDKRFIIPYNDDANLNKSTLNELANDFGGRLIPTNVFFGDNMLKEIFRVKGKKWFETTKPTAEAREVSSEEQDELTPIEGLNERLKSYGDIKLVLPTDFYEGGRPKGRLNSFKSSIAQVADNVRILENLNLNEFDFLSKEDKLRLENLKPKVSEFSKLNMTISSANTRTVTAEKRFGQLSNEILNEFVDIIGKHVKEQLGKTISTTQDNTILDPNTNHFKC